MKPNEAAFEAYVSEWLVEHGGYAEVKGPGQARPSAFDPVTGIDTEDLFAFLGATQAAAGISSSSVTVGCRVRRRSSSPVSPLSSTSGAPSTCCVTA